MGGILYTSPNNNFNSWIKLSQVHFLQFQPQYIYEQNEEVTRHSFISCCPSSLPLDHCAFPSGRLHLHSDFALQEGFPSLFLRPGPVDEKEPGHSDTFSKALQDRHGLWWRREERRYDPLIQEAFQRGCPLQFLQPMDIETRTGHHSLDSQVVTQSTVKSPRHPQTGPMETSTKTGFQHKSLKCSSLLGRSPAALVVLASSSVQEPGDRNLTLDSHRAAQHVTPYSCQPYLCKPAHLPNHNWEPCPRTHMGPLCSIEALLLQVWFLCLQASHQEVFWCPWT